jgi:hypothetical protein
MAPTVWGPNDSKSGWYIMVKETGYIPGESLVCPSKEKSYNLKTLDSQMLHYDYRYNSFDSSTQAGAAKYKKNVLETDGADWRPLFTDAAECARRHFLTIPSGKDWGWLDWEWAHMDGGNMISHGGSIAWVRNDMKYWPAEYDVRFWALDQAAQQ